MEKKGSSHSKQKKWLMVIQYFAAYLVAAWTFLQFVDWLLIRYNISPYWVDLMLWIFIGIIPSLIIYLYHRDRINQRKLKLREKIIFPANTILIALVLYLGFGNSDLGSTTKTIDYTTEEGESKSVNITKEEFRTGFGIFNFQSENADSSGLWIANAIPRLLYEDLKQNKNLDPNYAGFDNTTDKVKESKVFFDWYVDGTYQITDSIYKIDLNIRDSENGRILRKNTYTGKNLLDLIDEMSVYVTNYSSNDKSNKPDYIDLKLKEFLSPSIKAIEYYTKGEYHKAIKEDSTFAMAYLKSGLKNLIFNQGNLEEKWLAKKAYEYRARLPLQKQGEALILKYLAHDEFEKAEKLLNLQLSVDPNDQFYNSTLTNLYGRTKNVQKYVERAYNSYQKSRSPYNTFNYLNASLINKDFKKIYNEISIFQLANPGNEIIFTYKLMPQTLEGDIQAASETLDKIKLVHPDLANTYKVYEKAIPYLMKSTPAPEELKKFTGTYRSDNSEQNYTFWMRDGMVLKYVSNQIITPMTMAGKDNLITGDVPSRTVEHTFLKNNQGYYDRIYAEQNDVKGSVFYWLWKIDKSIEKAESLLAARDYKNAAIAYKKAIEAYPNHYFLKDALAHIEYVKDLDSITLAHQYKKIAGHYGPREFWVENNKLYYKRTDGEFPRIELLPLSNDLYINMTKPVFRFAFENINEEEVLSTSYQYIVEEGKWIKSELKGNTFKKKK